MGLARILIRAVLDLPTEKPAAPKPPRSLGVRMLLGTLDIVANSQEEESPIDDSSVRIWSHGDYYDVDGVVSRYH